VYVADNYVSYSYGRDVMKHAADWVAEGGFDGAILRDPHAGYTIGKVKKGQIVKVKPLLSLDLAVQRVHCSPGEKTGRPVYTVEVQYEGVTSMVGSGMPHDEEQVPLAGSIVEIECLGVTEDGKLREPRFKGIRHDKTQPD
jgi:DNA ligase-1